MQLFATILSLAVYALVTDATPTMNANNEVVAARSLRASAPTPASSEGVVLSGGKGWSVGWG
ncbi:hypothetical protein V7S43_004944 [Phytophthora oleae]|uniref:RxLR effector protein n=1 Tax=Phytophthora oleae TaxID=2107226 RepID=A0ABD3FRJ9_9STRA